MKGLGISFTWVEDEGEAICDKCKVVVVGKIFVAMIQFGEASDGEMMPMDYVLCEACYLED